MSIQARSIREIPGMGRGTSGKVYDYRGTGLCPPSGGRIRPLGMVHHIPVVRQAEGPADGVQLGRILKAEGLAIQAATDAEGNAFLYTRLDELCWGQRGANQIACGVEHMHYNVGEPWTDYQMRAAAWLANQLWQSYGVYPRTAVLIAGPGHVQFAKRGHTTHEEVSHKAGFNDRTDPGVGFKPLRLYELTRFYSLHHRF